MNVEIGGGAEALDQCNRTAVGFARFQSRLFEQKGSNDPVDHLQHRCEQLRMGGEQGSRLR